MNTFKKLFSVSAIVALIGTIMPMYAFGASYSSELNQAYDYAYNNGITTMDSIDNANMYGSLTRVAMAKMMANYSMDVLGLTPDTSMDCDFPDVSDDLDAQYDNGVTNACRLGLMGVGVDNFDPYGLVNRAQFGTVLSRALYGDTYNGADPYYADHLDALNDAGIMNNISNPNMLEVRGYVMLMMQRADEDAATTVGCTAEELLACITADDYDDCIAECSGEDEEDDTTITLDGDLEISEGSMPNNGSSIPNVGIVSFGEMDIDADGADIDILSMEFVREGLGARSDIDRVWMELDGKRVTGKAAVQANGVISMSFAPALVIKGDETLEFVVSIDGGAGVGSEHMFRLTDVDSSAEDADFDWESSTLRTANYDIAEVAFDSQGGGLTYKASDHDIELGQFELTNTNEDERLTTLKSITFRQKGNADLENLEDLDLYLNSDKVSSKTSIDGKYVTFTSDEDIDVNRVYRFYIRGNINAVSYEEGDTYQFELRNNEDMTIIETNTKFRASITGSDTTLSEYIVEGADIMLSTNSELESKTVSAGSTEEIMLGQIQVRAPALFEVTDTSSTGIVDINSTSDAISDIVSKVTLTIGSATATWTPDTTNTGITQTIKIDGTFYVNQKANVSMKVYLKANYIGSDSLSVTPLRSDSFDIIEYVSNENSAKDSVVGQIDGVILDVLEATAYLTRTDGFSTKNVVRGTNNVSLFEGELVTTTNSTININNITLTGVETDFSNNMTVSLYVDGQIVRTTNYRSEEALFTTNFVLTKDDSADIQIIANILSSINTDANDTFTVSFAGTDNYSDVENSTETATFTIKAEGSAILVKNTSDNTTKLIAANQIGIELGKFDIEASYDDLKLRELFVKNLSGVALNNRFNSFELVVGDEVVPGVFVDGDVKFDARSYNVVVPSDDIITAIVRVNSNNITSTGDVANPGVLLQATGIDMISTSVGGSTIDVDGAVISPSTPHMLVRGGIFASDVDGFVNSLTNVAKFNIMAVNNKVSLSGLTLEVSTSGITPGSIEVYNGTTLLGTGDNLTGTVIVSFTDTFDITTNSDLTVKFKNNQGIDNPYYEVTLEDIDYIDNFVGGGSGYVASVKDFDNVNLPITSVYGS